MRKILIGILLAIGVVVIFIPQILSSSVGKPFFERALGKKFNGKLTIGSVHLSWFGPQTMERIQFSNPDTISSIEKLESNVPLWRLSEFGNAFKLKNGVFSFPDHGNLSIGPVDALVAGQAIDVQGKASQGGTFTVNGKIYSKTDFDLKTTFNGMPSLPFDQLLKAKGILNASLGPSFDLSMTAVYNQGVGSLNADLSSQNAKASLRGQIVQDSLLLKEPLTASVNFTQDLAQALGGRVIGAKNPITLRIETAGASIPLKPFAISRLEIGKATLNLGQLVCTGLHPLISLFAFLNKSSIASSTAVIWFTPVEFAASGGTFRISRVDALIANSVHLCTWGNIQAPSGKLDGKLGVPADTLQQALGIQSLSNNYVLQIPISGTLQNPKFDTGPATTKMATLVGGKQLSKISKKTGALGNIFNVIPFSQEDKDVPPAKRPFPWEK